MTVITTERYEYFGGYYLAESVTDSGRVVLVESEDQFEALISASNIAFQIEKEEQESVDDNPNNPPS